MFRRFPQAGGGPQRVRMSQAQWLVRREALRLSKGQLSNLTQAINEASAGSASFTERDDSKYLLAIPFCSSRFGIISSDVVAQLL